MLTGVTTQPSLLIKFSYSPAGWYGEYDADKDTNGATEVEVDVLKRNVTPRL